MFHRIVKIVWNVQTSLLEIRQERPMPCLISWWDTQACTYFLQTGFCETCKLRKCLDLAKYFAKSRFWRSLDLSTARRSGLQTFEIWNLRNILQNSDFRARDKATCDQGLRSNGGISRLWNSPINSYIFNTGTCLAHKIPNTPSRNHSHTM